MILLWGGRHEGERSCLAVASCHLMLVGSAVVPSKVDSRHRVAERLKGREGGIGQLSLGARPSLTS